jgi:hypothetical protein
MTAALSDSLAIHSHAGHTQVGREVEQSFAAGVITAWELLDQMSNQPDNPYHFSTIAIKAWQSRIFSTLWVLHTGETVPRLAPPPYCTANVFHLGLLPNRAT